MRTTTRTVNRFATIAIALASAATVTSCGTVARKVSEEATTELAGEVGRHVVDHADGAPLASHSLLAEALHAVVDRDAAREETGSTFIPSYSGLDDRDGDGLDDDGLVQIDVRRASSCLDVATPRPRVTDGRC